MPGFSGGRGRGPQRPRDTDTSGGFSGFVPEGALKAAWNRALAGRQVAESGWSWNSSDVTVALIRSRDPQLREVSFTGAATLYTFRENDTVRNFSLFLFSLFFPPHFYFARAQQSRRGNDLFVLTLGIYIRCSSFS